MPPPAFPPETWLRFADDLTRLARHLIPAWMRATDGASDCVQEALLRGLRSAEPFQGTTEAELRAWLARIVRNTILDRVRRHQACGRDAPVVSLSPTTLPPVAEASLSPSAELRKHEVERELASARAGCTESERIVLELHIDQGLPFREIDRLQGWPEKTAGRRFARIVDRLRSSLRRFA